MLVDCMLLGLLTLSVDAMAGIALPKLRRLLALQASPLLLGDEEGTYKDPSIPETHQ